jgi:hypothetical protein
LFEEPGTAGHLDRLQARGSAARTCFLHPPALDEAPNGVGGVNWRLRFEELDKQVALLVTVYADMELIEGALNWKLGTSIRFDPGELVGIKRVFEFGDDSLGALSLCNRWVFGLCGLGRRCGLRERGYESV